MAAADPGRAAGIFGLQESEACMRFKRFRQFVAGALAVFMFMFSPVCDYAGAVEACAEVASGSDAEMADPAAEDGTDGLEEFDDGAGEYMPDNILSRYEESFEYCPETVPSPYARIALADDVVVVIVALLAMCGIYVGSNSDLVHQIASGFDTYIRRTAGNVKSVMEAWAAVLSAEAGKAIAGIKVLLPYLRDYLKSFFTGYGTGALEYSYSTGAGALTAGPYSLPGIEYQEKYNSYVCSYSSLYESNKIYDLFTGTSSVPIAVAYISKQSKYCFLTLGYLDDNDKYKYMYSPYSSWREYVPIDNAYKYSNGVTYYSSGGLEIWKDSSVYSVDDCIQSVANSISCPVFLGSDYARSYLLYGSLDGLIMPDPDFTVTVPNAWTQLQQDTFDRFGNTLTLPSTPEEWAAIQNQLASAATADDALDALSKVIDINSSGGITSMTPYLHLSYVLDAVSVYAGAGTLSADVRNGFLKDYLNITSAGGTIEQLNIWAQTVVNSQVTITGKDEDNDKNSFIITAALVAALLEYLYAQNLLEAIPDIAAGTQVRANVRVADKAVTPPDGGGSADLSGILSIISSILAAIGGLPALIATEAIKALASSAFANGITLNLDSIRTGIGQIAQWDFADWASALGAAVLLALRTAASDFGLDGVSGALDRIAGWDFSDWSVALGASVLAALKSAGADFGLDGVSGALDRIAKWNFADWANVLKGALDTALAGLGIGVIADHLADIAAKIASGSWSVDLSELKDWIAALPAAIAESFADAIEAEEEAAQEYQLSSIISDKFPFCIPFDLISCVTVLQAEPLEPRWELPFVVETEHIHIQESIVLDLSTEQWARPVAVIRSMLLLFYIVGLVILTRLLIKG